MHLYAFKLCGFIIFLCLYYIEDAVLLCLDFIHCTYTHRYIQRMLLQKNFSDIQDDTTINKCKEIKALGMQVKYVLDSGGKNKKLALTVIKNSNIHF